MSPCSSLYMLPFGNTIRHKSFSFILQMTPSFISPLKQIVYMADITVDDSELL